MASEMTGTVHGATIVLDAPAAAFDGMRVKVQVESMPEPEARAGHPLLAVLEELGPWEGETEAELQTRLSQARRSGVSRATPSL